VSTFQNSIIKVVNLVLCENFSGSKIVGKGKNTPAATMGGLLLTQSSLSRSLKAVTLVVLAGLVQLVLWTWKILAVQVKS